jgi:TonB family protein
MSMWQQWEGRVINGRFPLQQCLCGSTHSAVYLTEIEGLRAAIKLIRSDEERAQVQVLWWESVAKLSHPHLLRILDTGRWHASDGQEMLFAVMDYADENLAEVLSSRRLTQAEAKAMLLPTLDALNYLHGHGMVHGSVKPANIMAIGDELKLSSDGIRPASKSMESTASKNVHDAPEKAKGEILPSGDIWSLGATLVEALTNQLPGRDRKNESDPTLPENIAEPFNDIAKHCLVLDPKRRWSTAEIRQCLEQSPVGVKEDIAMQEASSVAGAQEVSAPAAPRHVPTPHQQENLVEGLGTTGKMRVVRTAAAVIVAVAAITAVVLLFQQGSKTSPPASTISARQSTASSMQPTENPRLQTSKPNAGSVDHGAVTHEVLPQVPLKARSTITGKVNVKVKVAVDASGAVSHAILVSRGPSPYFAEQALQAARKWTFEPPTVDGRALPSEWSLSFEFRKNGTTAAPQRILSGG